MLSLIRQESHSSMSSFLNRKSIHKHALHLSSTAKLRTSVGPRRLARSLLLSLSRRTEGSSGVAPKTGENASQPGPNEQSTGVTATEDPMQDRETVEGPAALSGASDHGTMTSQTSSDAGFAGSDDRGKILSDPKGERPATKLPLRKGQNVTHQKTEPLQQPASYKYLLVDDNDINLKILASFMKRLGHGYDTAVNGLEALQMYTANPGLYPFVLMGKSSWLACEKVH